MKNIIIIGAGGFARELYFYLKEYCADKLKGILVDNQEKYNKLKIEIPYLGKIKKYKIQKNDYFIIAFGNHPGKSEIYNYLLAQKANFYTFIHPSAIIAKSSKIGFGVVIMPFCIIGENSIIENNVFVNKFSNIGHDSIIKESSILSPYAMICGASIIGKNNFFGSQSILAPNLTTGDNCIISSNTFVRKNLKSNSLIFNSQKNIIKGL